MLDVRTHRSARFPSSRSTMPSAHGTAFLSHVKFAAVLTVAALVATPAKALATPVASTPEERAALGRTFPEPMDSTDFINLGPKNSAEEMKNGWSHKEKLYPGWVDFTTLPEELGDPNA